MGHGKRSLNLLPYEVSTLLCRGGHVAAVDMFHGLRTADFGQGAGRWRTTLMEVQQHFSWGTNCWLWSQVWVGVLGSLRLGQTHSRVAGPAADRLDLETYCLGLLKAVERCIGCGETYGIRRGTGLHLKGWIGYQGGIRVFLLELSSQVGGKSKACYKIKNI